MRFLWLAGACLAAACASVPIKPADQQDLARADALVRQGCYDCLREANDVYTRVAVGKARRLVALRLFETNLLLALREKEIGLDPAASMAHARAATDALPPVMDPDRYLADVEAVQAAIASTIYGYTLLREHLAREIGLPAEELDERMAGCVEAMFARRDG